MGLWQRFTLIFKSKASSALDKAEDPRQTLDYSYEKQLELLQKVRRGVADVATSRKRVELQITQLEKQQTTLESQARAALTQNREDLAREALSRKALLAQQQADLQAQYNDLAAQEEKLVAASQQLQAKIEAFRTKKETIKATYTAAEAQTKINEAVTGISKELGDVGLAVQRAEEKTANMQARAAAVDELLASGALQDATGTTKDSITIELERLQGDAAVEDNLARLKAEIGGSAAPAAVEAAPAAPAAPAAVPAETAVETPVDAEIVEPEKP